jgi:hypothetical protein
MRIVRQRSVSRFKLYRHCGRTHWCLWTRYVFVEVGEGIHKGEDDGWPE